MGNINKKTFSDQIYDDIREDILNHRIGFYEKLINRDLQEKYGVSSTPVRDAVNRLYLDGLVEEIVKSGARTIGFDRQYALEINEMMSKLLDDAIELSASKSDIKDVSKILNSIVIKQKNAIQSDEYFVLDGQFHRAFFEYSLNKVFLSIYDKYETLMELLFRYVVADDYRFRKNEIERHEIISSAFNKGDIISAKKLMQEHYMFMIPMIEKNFK